MTRIFTILFCLSMSLGFSQERFSSEFNPCKLEEKVDASKDQYCHNKIRNHTKRPILVLWAKENLLMPLFWDSYVCDNNQCYSPAVVKCPEDAANEVLVDSTVNMDVHFQTDGTQGGAHVVIWVNEKDDTTKKLKIDYLFNKTVSNNEVKNIAIKMYPNPASNAFTVEYNTGLTRVELYSILGKKVVSFNAGHFKSYDISNLVDGIYLVKLIGPNDQLLRTVRLQKRSPRA
ncbi:MAG TPA: T9SS type A sorting domain-containing protein [Saprospiraceae bacterium]|nr:T9SS type A sorting domain-containing protein [Saprospiraceae bacterium]